MHKAAWDVNKVRRCRLCLMILVEAAFEKSPES